MQDAFFILQIEELPLGVDSFFLDSGFLACEVAEVIQFCPAHFADFVDSDAFDGR